MIDEPTMSQRAEVASNQQKPQQRTPPEEWYPSVPTAPVMAQIQPRTTNECLHCVRLPYPVPRSYFIALQLGITRHPPRGTFFVTRPPTYSTHPAPNPNRIAITRFYPPPDQQTLETVTPHRVLEKRTRWRNSINL
uniref:Uncharacterized protein n=1 Tax=Romanomermis culicivorax TaxID=13658 RepID=A0A915HUP7_ROMCU